MTGVSPFDPLDRLEPGEGRFVLRQNDPVAPAVITEWSRLRRNRAFKLFGINPTGEAERALKAELAQAAEADQIALDWADTAGAAPEAEKHFYSGAVVTEEQAAEALRRRALAEAARHLREAAYHLNNIIEADGPECSEVMVMHLEMVNAIADAPEGVPEKLAD